jgi:hypothetical protein
VHLFFFYNVFRATRYRSWCAFIVYCTFQIDPVFVLCSFKCFISKIVSVQQHCSIIFQSVTNYFLIIAQYSDPGNVFEVLPLLTTTICRVNKHHSNTRFAYFCPSIEGLLKAYGHQILAGICGTNLSNWGQGVRDRCLWMCSWIVLKEHFRKVMFVDMQMNCIEGAPRGGDVHGHATVLHLGSTEGRWCSWKCNCFAFREYRGEVMFMDMQLFCI